MEWKLAFIIIASLVLVFILANLIIRHIKLVYRLAVWSAAGIVIILLANIFLDRVGLHIPINPATVLLVGILKIPGALMLVVLNYYFA